MCSTRWRISLCAAIAAAGVLSCGPDFEPYWKINELRVMAIKADPAVAKPFEPVTLRPLIHAPDDQPLEYDWSWCPFRVSAQDDFQCPVSDEELQGLLAELEGSENSDDGSDSSTGVGDDFFDLGDQEEAIFVNPFEADEVRQFCETIRAEVIEQFDDPEMAGFLPGGDCSDGYEITVRLQVSSEDDSVTASKRFLLWAGADQYNENPVIQDMQLRPYKESDLYKLRDQVQWPVSAGADHDDQWVSIPDDEPLRVVAEIPLELRTLIDPESVRFYTPPTPGGSDPQQPERRLESLVYRHFTTLGELASSRRIYAPDNNTLGDASNTKFSISAEDLDEECPDMDAQGCSFFLWAVVRDSRLGTDWAERRLVVEGEGQ